MLESCAHLHALEQRLDALVREENGRWLGPRNNPWDEWKGRYDAVKAWMKLHGLTECASLYQSSMGIQNASGGQCVVKHDPHDGAWLTLELPCSNIAELEAKLKAVGFISSSPPTVIPGPA
jgi:hypothetical protein